MNFVLVALGGALGSTGRYLLGGLVHRFSPTSFPFGTFVVNVVGCLLFGIIAGFAEDKSVVGPAARTFLLIGVLGGFTTFSSFTFETFALMRDGEMVRAMANICGQVLIGLAALWAGYVIARAV